MTTKVDNSSALALFAERSLYQANGSIWNFLNKKLGSEVVTATPTVDCSADTECSVYSAPWSDPKNAPADIVKLIFKGGKVGLSVRYIHKRNDGEHLVLEIFYQRASRLENPKDAIRLDKKNISIVPTAEQNYNGDFSVTLQEKGSISAEEAHWVSQKKYSDGICATEPFVKDPDHPSCVSETVWKVIKNLILGRPLEETENRYLPMYADRFV